LVKGVTRKLQKTQKDQYTVTIPKLLVQLLQWADKDNIEFDFEDGSVVIKKVKKK